MIAINIKMPENCHECDALGISDVVGLNCPCESKKESYAYAYGHRPPNCPLMEVCTLKVTSLAEEDEMNDWTEKFLIDRMGRSVANHPELMQTSNSVYTVFDEFTMRRTEAYLNIVMPK